MQTARPRSEYPPRQKYDAEIDCNDKFKAPLELAPGVVSDLLVLRAGDLMQK